MNHDEYVRIVPGAETAVLFLHGICGTPRHFDQRLPLTHLVPEDWSVYSVRLPGHGNTVEDFSKSTMKQWKQYVWKIFDRLSQTHRHVVVAGHSMGTLFSIQLALEKGEKVPFIFLIASPLCPRVSFRYVRLLAGVLFGNKPGKDKMRDAMHDTMGITTTRKLWKYAGWIPNFWNLLGECRRTKKLLPQLKTKTIVFQSRRDELVAFRSAKHLRRSEAVQMFVLEDSTHFFYGEADTKQVQQAFVAACNEVRG